MLAAIVDFVLHVDVHLATFVAHYGAWVYALLFAIIFIETGVVVMPFLPGDSLLFVVGAMCAAGLMSLPVVLLLLWLAAVLGNQSNYAIGRAPRAARLRLGAVALVQQARLRPGACVLRALRRHHHRRRALHAVPAHLRALRRRRRADDAPPLHPLRRHRRRALDRLGDGGGLRLRQHPLGQGQPRQDHLGRDPHSRAARHHRDVRAQWKQKARAT